METIPEGFDKILVGNIRGLTGTIEAGTVTMTEPGTEPSVTNSGTDTEAVFDFELPRFELSPRAIYDEAVVDGFTGTFDDWQREYLGGIISPDFPWCKGYFQDRSIPKNTTTLLTPVITDGSGDFTVSDTSIVIPEAGEYIGCVDGIPLKAYINGLLTFSLYDTALMKTSIAQRNSVGNFNWLGGATVYGKCNAGDTAFCSLFLEAAIASISYGEGPSFYISRIK